MDINPDIIKSLSTIRDYIRWAMGRFTESGVYFGHGTDNAWDEAVTLIFHLLHLPPETDDRLLDAKLTSRERDLIVRMTESRCEEKIPLPYLTNEAWFAGIAFSVDERVLIPRSPIAELIVNGFAPWVSEPVSCVLDLCTGSGCIGIACALHLQVQADLADLSDDALAVAQRNIELHGLGEQASIIKSDLFAQIDSQYDLIISNPPYVDAGDIAAMPREYHHEPRMALESGDDGLDCTRRILSEAARYLNDGGHLVLEVGNSWTNLEEAYPGVPFVWVEFANGGHGVCVLSKQELQQYF